MSTDRPGRDGWRGLLRSGGAVLLDWLYPPICVLCGAPGTDGRDLCAGCAADLPLNRRACPRCAQPFLIALPPGALCGTCERRPPPCASSLAAFRYEGPIPELVTGLKFRGKLNLARLLGQCLADAVQASDAPRPEALIPVPLHPARLRERGYNQALEIARQTGRALGLPVATDVCARIAATPPQTGLDARARRDNLRGAFVARPPWRLGHVAILDDVVTTGGTVNELGLVLMTAGARRVDVWAVARTP